MEIAATTEIPAPDNDASVKSLGVFLEKNGGIIRKSTNSL